MFSPGIPGKYFHCNSLGLEQILKLLTACLPPCQFVTLMTQQPGLALAMGTRAQNIHERCCHFLMVSLSFYSVIILQHVTRSKAVL